MDEEVETPKVLEELSKRNDAGSGGGSERQRRGRSGWLVVFLLLIPLLAGAALLGYQQWILYLRLNSLATSNNQLMESIQASNARLIQLEASSGQQGSVSQTDQANVDALRQEFSTRLEQLDLVINELSNRSSSSTIEDDGRVQLVEAEYLLRIANRHLQLTEDVATATALVESADQLLLDSGDSRVAQAREAIARDLGRLRNVEEVDIDG
ncbi:MAG: uroporphyrinogen-III C-methyltransferase, partial [Gammaproteobacteria bacterium]|nr:uroporphyrinogen-III C-methyltransferase [Gammaproteobacteria bacterium]